MEEGPGLHYKLKGGLLFWGMGLRKGCRGKCIMGWYKTYKEMVRGRSKGRERKGLRCLGEEQIGGNR